VKTYFMRRPRYKAVQYCGDPQSFVEVQRLLGPVKRITGADARNDTGNLHQTLYIREADIYLPAGYWLVRSETGALFVVQDQEFRRQYKEKK